MPTPFMHLDIAEKIQQMAVRNGHGRLADYLRVEWPAFYLGSVAPDINAISEIRRADTHFYTLPPVPENDAVSEMLAQFPELAEPESMDEARAIFVSAYSAHLMLDLIWLRQIVVPFFFEAEHLGSPEQRRLTHFILLAYLDDLALNALPDTAATTLSQATPCHWLPFITDGQLRRWRDMLVAQLQPAAPVRTVEIYAGRLNMTPEAFAAALHDPDWMEEQVFDKLPIVQIKSILQAAVPQSIQLISNYLQLHER